MLMKEPTNWMVINRTYAFGGAEIYQPKCGKTRTQILTGYVRQPKKFERDGECHGVLVGHVTADSCTRLLKDGVAFVKSSDDIMRVGLGSGAMLGGVDKELTFFPIKAPACKRADKLDKLKTKLIFWNTTKPLPDGAAVSKEHLQELRSCKRSLRVKKSEKDAINACVKNSEKSDTHVSAKCRHTCNTNQLQTAENIDALVDMGYASKDTVRTELKYWGKTLHDIDTVHHQSKGMSLPFIVKTKDGGKFAIAPLRSLAEIECADVEDSINRIISGQARALDDSIRDVLRGG